MIAFLWLGFLQSEWDCVTRVPNWGSSLAVWWDYFHTKWWKENLVLKIMATLSDIGTKIRISSPSSNQRASSICVVKDATLWRDSHGTNQLVLSHTFLYDSTEAQRHPMSRCSVIYCHTYFDTFHCHSYLYLYLYMYLYLYQHLYVVVSRKGLGHATGAPSSFVTMLCHWHFLKHKTAAVLFTLNI